MRARSLLALVPLIALVGCNGADDGKAAQADPSASAAASAPASPSEQAADPAPTTSAPAPQESSQAPAARPARPADPAGHPAAGMWQGPLKSGDRPTIMIGNDGSVQLSSAGFNCKGKAAPLARTFRLQITQCVIPLPILAGTLSSDDQSIVFVETKPNGTKSKETWRRLKV